MNSYSGSQRSKGLIFTMDVVFAVGITLVLLLIAMGVLVSTKASAVNDINAKRVASDIAAVLDYNDVLDTFNIATITDAVNATLPANVLLYMRIGKYNKDGVLLDYIDINGDIPENFFYGKWIFVTTGQDGLVNNFYLVRYKVGFA